jgi:hypothetical protein
MSKEFQQFTTGDWCEPLLGLKTAIRSYEDAMLNGDELEALRVTYICMMESMRLNIATESAK